ncbi:MAG TPA: hypothetical protein VNX66_17685 [Candidatus Sulfotelmatobacter sp.]|jgi:hypothetical protein|nr:hypothetical protein [Candidatus Sulfotelmatobacter sp.]
MPINRLVLQSGVASVLEKLLLHGGGLVFPPLGLPPGPVTTVQGPGQIGFKLNGTLVWHIDVKLFAGNPTLTSKPTPQHGLRIQLKGARFPGTELSADFVCVLGPRGFLGTPMDLTFVLGGFHGQAVFERWLAGTQVLQSSVTLDSDVCALGDTSKLAVAGTAEARFAPNWLFSIGGTKLATITGLGPDIPSDLFQMKLLFPGDPSLSSSPKSRRTLLSLAAGTAIWQLRPAPLDLSIGTLKAADGLFDRIDIETGESPAGDVARVLVASSTRPDGLALRVAGVTNLDGGTFDLALILPSYAIAFDVTLDHSKGDETTITARFASSPQWMVVDGFAMALGDHSGTPGFEVDASNGVETSVRCEPGLLLAAAPLAAASGAGVATRPLPLSSGPVLPIVNAAGPNPGWGVIAGVLEGQPRISLPDFAVTVLRRDDLFSLDFLFFNLALEGGGGQTPQLKIKDADQPAYLVARFNAPQNIAEQAFLEADPPANEDPTPAPVQALAAGPSHLAFQLPTGMTSLPYALDALLDWVKLPQSVIDTKGLKVLRPPLPTETSIEAPWHLFLSPEPNETWTHAALPVTQGDRTELWHTRLAVRVESGGIASADENAPRQIRAVWSPDYSPVVTPAHGNVPFRMSLDPNDRDQIVRLSSDFTIPQYRPPAIHANKLFLTALGAWMDVLGDFDPFSTPERNRFSLLQWRHIAGMGRDSYVRVVTAGYLCHPGNRAVVIKITERKFQRNPSGRTTAYLRQRFIIVVKEPVKNYSFLTPEQQRAFPFKTLRITTLVTPNLDTPGTVAGKLSFFPSVGGKLFPFHLVGTDADGQTTEFTSPLYFVELAGEGDYATAVNNWNTSSETTRDFAGQKVAFADSSKPGDTTLHTSNMTFVATARPGGDPPFFPQMDGAAVTVPAIQQITGQPGGISIKYFPAYVASGFGPGGVFVQNAGSPLTIGFSGDQSGGVATPNLQVSGLSRQFGTVSGALAKIASGNLDPVEYFGDVKATLFGVIPLQKIIQAVFGDETVPKLLTERLPNMIRTKLHWAPKVQNVTVLVVSLEFDNLDAALTLDALIETPLTGGTPQVSVSGALTGFALTLGGVIGIKFKSLNFNASAGKKLDVAAEIEGDGLQFLGDLSFLNELRKIIPSDGFQDPPSLEVTTEGVTAGYSLAIPSIGIGVFSLENIKLSAALTLPFLPPAPLRFRFAFAERESPFIITVSLLGGGGFFGIAVGPDGVEMLEASFEIGAQCSIDVVVATGSVHIMAGVYLKIDLVSNESQLTGYLRAGGSLDVLGLISASVEFYLGFTYYFGPPCKIAGEATITIEVHVLFFSASVHASLRREFSDPQISFADLIAPADWNYYCDSFAA